MAKIVIIGNTSHCNQLANQLDPYFDTVRTIRPADFKLYEIRKLLSNIRIIKNSDVVYGIFSAYHLSYWIVARLFSKKTINHWIGTDVYVLFKKGIKYDFVNILSKFAQKLITTNVIGSEFLKEELNKKNIDGLVIPLIAEGINLDSQAPPEEHAVLTYIPNGREEFYNLDMVINLASEFTDVNFIVVGNDGKNVQDRQLFKNISFKGYVSKQEMDEIYSKVSILIRLPIHDGFSMMVIEAMAKGKTVIYRMNQEGTIHIGEYEELRKVFKETIKSKPTVNHEAVDYVKGNLNKKTIVEQIRDVILTQIISG
ncbi:MAG: hypothetical protein CVU87_11005 [Firmicutes bacterium HGW-Firmicutes-12]|jgi:hypothetical protein|nr:MAG: hypothetical protein CVU87_11005 [Firmicutes bacterium HGW-Firmicutes-12]